MQNTKLINLLKSFSKNEINRFEDFVKSPYYNKNAKVMRLSDTILAFYPDFGSPELIEEKVFERMFPGEEFDYFKIKNIISDLYQLGLEFIKVIADSKKGIENEIDLLGELHERKLNTMYAQKEKQISKNLSNFPIRDESFHYAKYRLAKSNTSHFKFKGSDYSFDLIQNEFDAFLNYALISFLRHYSKMLTNSNHGNISFKLEMFDNVWDYVKDKDFADNPQCSIYKKLISLELYKEEKDYRAIIELKDKYKDNLSIEDYFYILLAMNSYCAYRLKLGDEEYYTERFNVFKEIIERKIMIPDNMLFVNFVSVFTSACMTGNYQWAEKFSNDFKIGITPGEETDNTLNYCRGFLEYRKKNYDAALSYFSKTNFRLFLMKVMVKSYSLRIYFEQNLFELTFTAIDSFKHYLKSEKYITDDQKTAHFEFLKNIGDLTRLKLASPNNIEGDLEILKDQIRNMTSNPLGAKNWLIQKAIELGHKTKSKNKRKH